MFIGDISILKGDKKIYFDKHTYASQPNSAKIKEGADTYEKERKHSNQELEESSNRKVNHFLHTAATFHLLFKGAVVLLFVLFQYTSYFFSCN